MEAAPPTGCPARQLHVFAGQARGAEQAQRQRVPSPGPQWHAKQAGCCARLHRCPQLYGMSAERSGAALFPWLEHVAVCRPFPSTARTRGGRAAAAYVDYASCGIVDPAGRQQSGRPFAREKGEAKGYPRRRQILLRRQQLGPGGSWRRPAGGL